MSFADFALQAYGLKRPPKPSADQEASSLMCDPKWLCGKDNDTSCESFETCRQKVAQIVNTNGLDRPFANDGDVQKNVFISQHFDILNATKADKSLSQFQAMLALLKAIPSSVKIMALAVGSMFACIALFPAIVITYKVLSQPVAMAKIITLLVFTILIIGMYFLVPL
jgi:hypothetical protein